MATKLAAFLFFISVLSFFPGHAHGETASPEAARGAKASKPENKNEDPDKTYWCNRSAYYKKRIENARYEVNKEEALLSDLRDAAAEETGKDKKYIARKIRQTEDNLTKANKILKERESDLARIEDEARKKKIPPEWLRCEPAAREN